jgi:DNA-binding protein H-NS
MIARFTSNDPSEMTERRSLLALDKQLAQINAQRDKLIKSRQATLLQQFRILIAQALECGLSSKELTEELAKSARDQHAGENAPPKRGRKRLAITKATKQSQPRREIPAMYLGPEGQTWSGRGRAPRWLADLSKEARKQYLISDVPAVSSDQKG